MQFIKETTTKIYNKKIKNNIKILFFSDIHYSGIKDINKLNRLYKIISNIKASYICISGDVIDNNDAIKDAVDTLLFIDWIKKISKVSKVLIGIGNHDQYIIKNKVSREYFKPKFWELLNSIDNVYVLNNNSYKDDNIYSFGYTLSYNYYYKYGKEDETTMINEIDKYKVNKDVPNNKLNILLMHSPILALNDKIEKLLKDYDLILCGHMHNGMILPLIDEIFDNNRGIVAPDKKLFPKLARGIVDKDNTIIISGGITKISRMASSSIRWVNNLFPISMNIIEITNEKCKMTKTHKYYK